jgi:hypothetical protein
MTYFDVMGKKEKAGREREGGVWGCCGWRIREGENSTCAKKSSWGGRRRGRRKRLWRNGRSYATLDLDLAEKRTSAR